MTLVLIYQNLKPIATDILHLWLMNLQYLFYCLTITDLSASVWGPATAHRFFSFLSQSACPSTDHRPVVHSSIRPIQSRFPCVSYISSHPSNGHNGYSVQLEFFFIPPIRDRRRPIVICGIFTFKLTVFFFLIRILKSRCIAFVFFFAFFKGRFSIMTNRIGVVACFPI